MDFLWQDIVCHCKACREDGAIEDPDETGGYCVLHGRLDEPNSDLHPNGNCDAHVDCMFSLSESEAVKKKCCVVSVETYEGGRCGLTMA